MGTEAPDADLFDKPHYSKVTALIQAIFATENGPAFCDDAISFDEIKKALSAARITKRADLIELPTNP